MSTDDIWDEFDSGGDADGDFPDRFEFVNPGDKLVGEVTRVDKMPTRFGDVPVLDVRDDEGKTWSVGLFHTNLRRQVAAERPTRGDRIALAFTGMGEAKPGKNAPYLYDVAVKRAEAGAAEAPQPEVAPAPAATSAADLL